MRQCIVKISISTAADYFHIDDVVYYRSGMNPDFVTRWMWFFEYLTARIKVANPRCRVELWHGPADIMLGEEWRQYRRKAMLKSRNIKLRQLLRDEPDGDLFGFAQADHEGKIESVRQQIIALENDVYDIPEFPEYINKLKQYINHASI